MATITDKSIVDRIIEGNGIYPGDEDMPIVKIVKYQNAFNGGDAYGLIYKGESLDRYTETVFVINPKTIWEHESIKKSERPLGHSA